MNNRKEKAAYEKITAAIAEVTKDYGPELAAEFIANIIDHLEMAIENIQEQR